MGGVSQSITDASCFDTAHFPPHTPWLPKASTRTPIDVLFTMVYNAIIDSTNQSSFFTSVSSTLSSWSSSLQKETEQSFPGTMKRFGDLTQLVQQKARELPSNIANLPSTLEAEHQQFVKGNLVSKNGRSGTICYLFIVSRLQTQLQITPPPFNRACSSMARIWCIWKTYQGAGISIVQGIKDKRSKVYYRLLIVYYSHTGWA